METMRVLIGWCALINLAVLLIWGVMFWVARPWVHRMHTAFGFELTRPVFDAMHYGGLGLFKMLNLMFFIAPYLVLRFAF